MLSERLALGLSRGVFELPDAGWIAVISPPAAADLSALPKNRVEVIQRNFPEHARFEAAGFKTEVHLKGPYTLSILCLPRSKPEARDAIARAVLATEGPVVIDGQRKDGVDSVLKELRGHGDVGEVLSKAHGKFFAYRGDPPPGWEEAGPARITERFQTRFGVFSADDVDPGSALLENTLPERMSGSVIDLGAGWGYLASEILRRSDVAQVDLVEADHVALDCARANINDPRARFHWADARDFTPDEAADHVVTNPPFHSGRAQDSGLGQAFIRSAARMLKPKGALWLVANRHLPYEHTLNEMFDTVQAIGDHPSYKVFKASSPRRPRKG
ncbi:MAG: class I SAM-dependent methyltransferase [Paracoccaceae bacterium]|nr:class I SAM-dependent methyltransferase [Paracoccaceae bacterium]